VAKVNGRIFPQNNSMGMIFVLWCDSYTLLSVTFVQSIILIRFIIICPSPQEDDDCEFPPIQPFPLA